MAYESTSVAVSKSQQQIRDMLRSGGASGFSFTENQLVDLEGSQVRVAQVNFLHIGHQVRILVPLKSPDKSQVAARSRRSRVKTYETILDEEYEQEARRIWRVLYWSIKARMVAIEEGVETFEQAFLAHLVDPSTGRTLYETFLPAIAAGAFLEGGGGLLALPRSKGGPADE